MSDFAASKVNGHSSFQQVGLPEDSDRGQDIKVAYIMSRFPKLTETFILYEMLTLEQAGVEVEVYPLLRESTALIHAEARSFVERAHFHGFISWPIIRANVRFMWRKPRSYFGALYTLLRGTAGSLRFFTGALGIFPKTVLFAEEMASSGVSHIHAHFASHPAAAAFVIRRLVGIPFSFTAHGSDIHRDKTMLCEKVAEASFVVPVSLFNKKVILEACDGRYAEKMHIIHCGVDTEVFRPADNGSRPRKAPFTFLCIGTLHEVKGQTYLIEACRLLHSWGVDFACHLIGHGPDRTILEEQVAQAGLTGRVYFLGRRTRDEVAELIRDADVVVAPSVPSRDGRREGIPVALMEAMAAGTPVVASRLSGIPELVIDNENGLLAPPGDANAVASALERLYTDVELRQRLGRAGRDKVLREFDLITNGSVLAYHFGLEARV